jgi:hypothetical protein
MFGEDACRPMAKRSLNLVLEEPYAPRPITALGLETIDGWRIKVYGIAYDRPTPRRELVDAALEVAAARLPHPAVTWCHHGAAFLGVHDGRGVNFVFVDWWQHENELQHHVYLSPSDTPAALRPAAADVDPIACAWDLHVLAHERDAWVRHVLARPGEPDLDAYCADVLTGVM